LMSALKLIGARSSAAQKLCFRLSENMLICAHPASTQRGASANRHERWGRDAMDALVRLDEARGCGRQRRVVLAPRRWRQVLGDDLKATGAIKPGTPGSAP